jgi:uncharacterized protein YjiS (DUF1127 family)
MSAANEMVANMSVGKKKTETSCMFSRILAFFDRMYLESVTRDELSRLSDRELKDIGLTRYDVDYVARHGNLPS